MKLKNALVIGFGATLVTVLGVVLLAFFLISQLTTQWWEKTAVTSQRSDLISRASMRLGYASLRFHNYVREGGNSEAERFSVEMQVVDDLLDAYGGGGPVSDEERRRLDSAKVYANLYRQDMQAIINLRSVQADKATQDLPPLGENEKRLTQDIRRLTEINNERMDAAAKSIGHQFNLSRMALLLAALAAAAGVILVGVLATRTVLRRDEERNLAMQSLQVEIGERTKAETELEHYRDHLEHLVEERTAELNTARAVADAANQAKSGFLANMSHEIRTPMNAIIGLTQLALDTPLDEQQRDYLTKVQTSSQALLGILNSILDYSKIEAGCIEIETVDFSLEDVLRSTADLFSVRADEKGLELFIDLAPDVPARLVGDPLRLSQVINNLVGNSIKFTQQGEVHVRVELAESTETTAPLEGNAASVGLRVVVRDTGIGLDPAQAARLFQPFVQADASVTRRFGGTGLGLTISKRLVELMGGQLTLSSELGRGSTFVFTARLGLSTAAPEVHAKGNGLRDLRAMRSLVVDDQETSLTIMRSILERWHFRVDTASSGEEALKLFQEARARGEPYDLLVLDWKMPGMNGLDTARAIEAADGEQGGRPPTIVMVTAYSRDELLKDVENIDIDAILAKPVTPSSLFNTLIQLQQGKSSQFTPVRDVFGATRAILSRIRGARILLVEDNELNQQVAREFLVKGGLNVTVADDGLQALQLVQRNEFDAVLMDLHMPVMDGFESTRQIRALPKGAKLPIIAMTAAAMSQDREASAAAGMNDHVSKPVDPRELADSLVRWVKPTPEGLRENPGTEAPADDDAAAQEIDELEHALPGVSIRTGLARMGGNRVLYRRLLRIFAERHQDIAGTLRALLQAGNLDQLYMEAHNLKGEAGNLGFDSVKLAADLLGQQIRFGEGERVPELTAILATQCETMLATLRKLPGNPGESAQSNATNATNATSSTNPTNPTNFTESLRELALDRVLPLLNQLAPQLKSRNLAARHLASEISEMTRGTELAEEFALIMQGVQQLRYDAALASLGQLLDRHQWRQT